MTLRNGDPESLAFHLLLPLGLIKSADYTISRKGHCPGCVGAREFVRRFITAVDLNDNDFVSVCLALCDFEIYPVLVSNKRPLGVRRVGIFTNYYKGVGRLVYFSRQPRLDSSDIVGVYLVRCLVSKAKLELRIGIPRFEKVLVLFVVVVVKAYENLFLCRADLPLRRL
jgi:hypothetical protein